MEANSIQCQTCAGPLPAPIRSHAKCEYCGNVHKVFSNGKTIVTGTTMPAPPKPLKQIFLENPVLAVILAFAMIFTPLLAIVLIKKKTKAA